MLREKHERSEQGIDTDLWKKNDPGLEESKRKGPKVRAHQSMSEAGEQRASGVRQEDQGAVEG